MVIMEWPSLEAAEAFYSDPAYRPHLEARLAGSTCDAFIVEAKDDFAPIRAQLSPLPGPPTFLIA
jgi:Domain of unknown function (DUF1330)